MAVPKRRTSKAKLRARRAANSKIHINNPTICARCGEQKLPHRACPYCGYYKNRLVVTVVE